MGEPALEKLRERLSLPSVAAELDVHVATVWRWVLHGVKGRKLKSILIGGRRAVLREDLAAFITPKDEGGKAQVRASAEDAGKRLDDIFGA